MATSTVAKIGVEIGAAFAGNFKTVFGQASSAVSEIGGQIKKLEGRQKELNAVIAQQQRLGANGSALKALYSQQELDQISSKLERLKNQQQALNKFGTASAGVGKAMGEVGAQFRSLATQAAVAGAGLGYFFKKNFVDVAAQFERFQAALTTIEGSSDKAKQSMAWIQQFARTTPYELGQVTEAFIKLRARGFDPTKGMLETLGDTASGLQLEGGILQAVEAIADAVNGEGERLKEAFNITQRVKGDEITYLYKDLKTGADMSAKANKNNRTEIEKTLTTILKAQYGGAMKDQSKTFSGMMSNLSDAWTGFVNQVMAAGVFDRMKDGLGSLLARIDEMDKNGTLAIKAKEIGDAIINAADAFWKFSSAVVNTTKKIADFVGGWENLGIILVAIKFAPLIFSVGQLAVAMGTATTSLLMFATGTATAGAAWMAMGAKIVAGLGMIGSAFKVLAAFMLTNPIGIAITLLSVAGYMLWKNWDGIKGGLLAIWEAISAAGVSAFNWLRDRIGEVMDWIGSKVDWIFNKLTTAKQMYVDLFGGDFGKAFDGLKSFYGFGDAKPAATPAPATTAPTTPVAPVPAARTAPVVQQTNNPSYNINVQTGASDPNAVAKAIRAEMERKERERQANNRAAMADNLGN